jgi:hypothetical protein
MSHQEHGFGFEIFSRLISSNFFSTVLKMLERAGSEKDPCKA